MDLTLWPDSIAQTATPSIVTVGMFDGVHAGHRFLLSALAGEARSRGLRPVALTFDRHPLSIIDPLRAPAMLAPLPERLAMMEACGCTAAAIHFDEATRRLTATQFMATLRSQLGAETLLMGFNHRLGHDRLSTPGKIARPPPKPEWRCSSLPRCRVITAALRCRRRPSERPCDKALRGRPQRCSDDTMPSKGQWATDSE